MGTPNKTSYDYDLNGLDVYPSLYGSSPLMSNRIIPAWGVLTTFVLPIHNQGASLAINQGQCPPERIPAGYQLTLCLLLIQNTLHYSTFRWTLPVMTVTCGIMLL